MDKRKRFKRVEAGVISAEKALIEYIDTNHSLPDDSVTAESLIDLLIGLHHWADSAGYDFELLKRTAKIEHDKELNMFSYGDKIFYKPNIIEERA